MSVTPRYTRGSPGARATEKIDIIGVPSTNDDWKKM
jgi:hypothetical protein